MGRILTEQDKVLRPHLIEYDRNDPSPHFTSAHIRYIETRQDGFSESELAWIRDYEYFIFNLYYTKGLVARVIPGLRSYPGAETQYVMRYNTMNYQSMMDDFLSYKSPDLPEGLSDYCNMPGCRFTTLDKAHFYPINYHEDLPGWRKLISESAKLHDTLTGQLEGGKFVLSDGRRVSFSDLTVASLTGQVPYPPDW